MSPESFGGVAQLPALVWSALKFAFFVGVLAVVALEIHRAIKGPQQDERNELYETRRKRKTKCPRDTNPNRSSR